MHTPHLNGGDSGLADKYSAHVAAQIKDDSFDAMQLATRPLPYERLDQLVIELLLGVR